MKHKIYRLLIITYVVIFTIGCCVGCSPSDNKTAWGKSSIKLINTGLDKSGGYFDFNFKESASDITDTWYALQIMKNLNFNVIQYNSSLNKFIDKKLNKDNIVDCSNALDILDFSQNTYSNEKYIFDYVTKSQKDTGEFVNANFDKSTNKNLTLLYSKPKLNYSALNIILNVDNKTPKINTKNFINFQLVQLKKIYTDNNLDDIYYTLASLNKAGYIIKDIPYKNDILNSCKDTLKKVTANKDKTDLSDYFYSIKILELFDNNSFEKSTLIKQISNLQNKDGGFGFKPGDESNFPATYYCTSILKKINAIGSINVNNLKSFIRSKEVINGGYQCNNVFKTDIMSTSVAMQSLSFLNSSYSSDSLEIGRAHV